MLLVATVLVATGCSIPGAGRLQGPPEGLPAAIEYLPGDALGWTIIDTDPDASRWGPIESATRLDLSKTAHDLQWEPFFGDDYDDAEDVAPWVGATAGTALLSSQPEEPDALLGFADVEDRGKLEAVLRDGGWTRDDADLGEGAADDLELWRGGDSDRSGARFDVIGISDAAMVGANDVASLRAILRQRERYPAIKRKATNTYTVEAMARTPFAVVYRSDMVRDQLRRLIADDRGALELSRWVTSMGSIRAWRDGWIGVAPPIDESRTAVRLIGATDWVKDLSTQGEPAPVPLATLGRINADARLAVALHDPGLYAEDLLRAGPGNGATFATEEDPRDSGDVDLFDVVDRYDGDAAIGLYRDRIELHMVAGSDRDELLADTEAAIRVAGVRRLTAAGSGGQEIELTWSFAGVAATTPPHPTLQDSVDLAPAFARAGTPPRAPVAWIWANPSGSASDAIVGWITWDRTERLTYAFDVPLGQLADTARLID